MDSKRIHTPIKSNKIIPNACQHMSTLLPSEILKTDTTLRILPFLPGNSSDGPRPTIFTNSAWSLPLHLLCEAMLPGIWNSCGFGSFWKHLDGFNAWKIANWGSSFLRGVEKKNQTINCLHLVESTKVLHARSATRFSLYSTFAEPWQNLCASPVFTNRAIPCNSTPQTDPSADGKLYERQWDFLHL